MTDQEQPLDPYKTMLVIYHGDQEVSRIAATAKNAEAHLTELARFYGDLRVEYVQDENAWIDALFRGG